MATRKPKHPSQAPVLVEIEPGIEIYTEAHQPINAINPATGKRPLIDPSVVWRGGRKPGSKNKKVTRKTVAAEIRHQAKIGITRREESLEANLEASKSIRDIAPLPMEINWDRRRACKLDFALFCKTYLPNTFKLGWSKAHLACIEKIELVCLGSSNNQRGKFALAMPRGEGKTALCRAAIIWCTAFAHRQFPFLIGSAQPKAVASLEFIKMAWYGSPELRLDFPEIAHAIHKLNNRWHLAAGQIYRGQSTYIDWGSDFVRYPILLLSREIYEEYEQNDPGFCIEIPAMEGRPLSWITRSAGITINTAGVDGSIRGEAGVHPILLTQPRPDVVLIDDVQKDNKVDSSLACDKLKLLIDGAIGLLSGPDEPIAAIMPCTVMRENDVADTYVNPDKRPEWRGERHARVISWPEGIDDERITLDSPAGLAWTEYDRLRRKSLKEHKDTRLATAYYIEPDNRKTMDEGFVVSWDERKEGFISAQEACMNLRFEVGSQIFMAECQNKGRKPSGEGIVPIRKQQLMEKTSSLPRGVVPRACRSLVVYIDVQNEILYWVAFACDTNFTGTICDYGTYPEAFLPYFRKSQTEEWSLLSKEFFEAYPDQRNHPQTKKTIHGIRAPLEAKIYYALNNGLRSLLARRFVRDDTWNTPVHISRIGIDIKWGQVNEAIKRFIRDWSRHQGQPRVGNSGGLDMSVYAGRDILVPCMGRGITPIMKQMEEFQRTEGWVFEDDINPSLKQVNWIWRPDAMGQYELLIDSNRVKSFLFQRFASPPGSPGSISLFAAPPDEHELFAEHITESEYPYIEKIESRLMTASLQKEMWKAREGGAHDNDWLDGAAGCMALAGFNGMFLQHVPDRMEAVTPRPARLSDVWAQKRQEAR